jgi:hypothetical protein
MFPAYLLAMPRLQYTYYHLTLPLDPPDTLALLPDRMAPRQSDLRLSLPFHLYPLLRRLLLLPLRLSHLWLLRQPATCNPGMFPACLLAMPHSQYTYCHQTLPLDPPDTLALLPDRMAPRQSDLRLSHPFHLYPLLRRLLLLPLRLSHLWLLRQPATCNPGMFPAYLLVMPHSQYTCCHQTLPLDPPHTLALLPDRMVPRQSGLRLSLPFHLYPLLRPSHLIRWHLSHLWLQHLRATCNLGMFLAYLLGMPRLQYTYCHQTLPLDPLNTLGPLLGQTELLHSSPRLLLRLHR